MRRLRWPLAGGILVVTSLSGCVEQQYDVPSEACGLNVSPDRLSAILPDGEELTDAVSEMSDVRGHCEIRVDNSVALVVIRTVDMEPMPPMEVATEYWTDILHDPEVIQVGDAAVVGDRGVAAESGCRHETMGDASLILRVVVDQGGGLEDDEIDRAALEAFAREILPEAAAASGCAPVE